MKTPFIQSNLFITDITIKDYFGLMQCIEEHRSVWHSSHNKFYPAAVIANWNYTLVVNAFRDNTLYIVYNLSKYKKVIEPKTLFEDGKNIG